MIYLKRFKKLKGKFKTSEGDSGDDVFRRHDMKKIFSKKTGSKLSSQKGLLQKSKRALSKALPKIERLDPIARLEKVRERTRKKIRSM